MGKPERLPEVELLIQAENPSPTWEQAFWRLFGDLYENSLGDDRTEAAKTTTEETCDGYTSV